MISLENSLIEGLPEGEIDGHDFGSGEFNIFIRTNNPLKSFERLKKILESDEMLDNVRAAYRDVESEEYTVVWPTSLRDFKVL
ncbi:ABC transporter [Mesorhizobium huakuii]|uniref:ABC transporter n=1 Tax=Mesorhizobium huakuii TaxID=28104 RepID=A0A7G6SPC1_9HYPH|nr:ABC transporter [Mesorhizobium huakuii]QND56353.1 ABC transporter [Mesorhizobium huakuii]